MSGWNFFGAKSDAAPSATPLDESNPAHATIIAALMKAARGSRSDELHSPFYEEADRSVAYHRYNGVLTTLVPWLRRLTKKPGRVVEIGCGSGSTTAAFATVCEHIVGYDFEPSTLDIARTRLSLLGVTNAEVRQVQGEHVADVFAQHQGIDGVILYAVLEHMTVAERLSTLKAAWAALKPGGFILVGETPNRLAYWDHHTSNLPFYNQLPPELALAYYDRTDRPDVRLHLESHLPLGQAAAELALVRSGYQGVSYHEFELAFGVDYGRYLISSPDDPEVRGIYGDYAAEEAALINYAVSKQIDLHPSFCAAMLTLLFRKPNGSALPEVPRLAGVEAPGPEFRAAPAAASETGPRAPTIEEFRSFARDPANFDAFADMMTEALAPHVYLTWDHDAAYKRHFKRWQKAGFTVLPNHYYSPVPDMNELTDAQLTARYPLHGVAIDEGEHRALLEAFKSVQAETTAFRSRNTPTTDGRWYSGGAFGLLDAQVAYAMVRTQKPKRIIEIGTGFSTLAMAEACERNAAEGRPVEFTTIDPYPSFAVALNPKGLTRNLTVPVESLPIEQFEALEPGDILFIDSTHIIRPGGDVEYEYFHILPRLKPGVWIHVHDIFFPLPYPPEWARDRHIFWNEQQLLNAFLAYNHAFRSKMALSAACYRWIDAVKDAFPGTGDRPGPGSFWMQRIA